MPTVGRLIVNSGESRDAIHVAIAPMVAGQRLTPGQHVGLDPLNPRKCITYPETVGIVDPFLTRPVNPGDMFWLFLYPETVTSLRHEWTHPAFPVPQAVGGELSQLSQLWLEEYAAQWDLSGSQLIEAATDYLDNGNYFFHPEDGGRLEGEYVNDEFWVHFERATGRLVPEDSRDTFFRCSC